MEAERKRMQQAGEISGVAGVNIGDKRSYVRLVGRDGKLLEEGKVSTRRAALERTCQKKIFPGVPGCA